MRVTDVMKQSAYWGGRVDNAAEVAGKSRYLLGNYRYLVGDSQATSFPSRKSCSGCMGSASRRNLRKTSSSLTILPK